MNLLDLASWPLEGVLALFGAAALVIAVVGARLTRVADRLADVTGLGEALVGAVLLGAATSLPGILTSVVTAHAGYAQLAASNALGGIAAQTMFLALADVAYRGANLEHAAASLENLVQSALLMTLVALPLLAMAGPDVTLWGVHPVSLALLLAYGFGMNLVRRAQSEHLWNPEITPETRLDEPEAEARAASTVRLGARFAGLALVVAVAGWAVAQSGMALADRTGLSETVVGGLLTAVATSLPELVTSIAAVRQGALTLAVGGILGGNAFDVLFLAFADVAYREGSLYHALGSEQVFVVALTIVLTGVMLLGLLRRERHGMFGIGFESVAVIVLYVAAMALLFAGG